MGAQVGTETARPAAASAPLAAAPDADAPPDDSAGLPLLAFVGRPNVGKSTLFNRVIGRRSAIVQDLPGTTRDRLYGETEWRGVRFRAVDTGGLLGEQLSGPYADEVAAQVRRALDEADAICLVVDVQAGLTPADADIAVLLREAAQPVYVAANKADNETIATGAPEFYALGLGEPRPISAHHGLAVAELLDAVVERLPAGGRTGADAVCRLAIVGRPNVGKSSITNALLDDERMIVSPVAGTTRDAVDTPIDFNGQRLTLIDTAGIRRRGRIETGPEKASVRRARAAIGRADVVAVVLDAAEDIGSQDQHILGMALEAHKGLILVLNKADLIADDPEVIDRRQRQMRWRTRFVPWAPVVWTSALTGEHLPEILNAALKARAERQQRVPTGPLNAAVKRAVIAHPPASYHGRPIKFFYATQAEIDPPTFVFFVNYPEAVHFSYERYLQRRIRQEFGFGGTAIHMHFRKRGGDTERHA